MGALEWALAQMTGDIAAKLVLVQMAAEVEPPSHPILVGPPWTYSATPFRLARLAAQCGLDEVALTRAVVLLADAGLLRHEEGDVHVLGMYAERRWVAPSVANRAPVPPEVRRAVIERDGSQCVNCGATDGLHVDHIYPRWLGGLNVVANLQTLCGAHNMEKGMRAE